MDGFVDEPAPGWGALFASPCEKRGESNGYNSALESVKAVRAFRNTPMGRGLPLKTEIPFFAALLAFEEFGFEAVEGGFGLFVVAGREWGGVGGDRKPSWRPRHCS